MKNILRAIAQRVWSSEALLLGVVLFVSLVLFLMGWFSHKRWSAPELRVVTVKVPVTVGAPVSPQINHPNGVVTPEVKYVYVREQPAPPNNPVDKPMFTVVTSVPVLEPTKRVDVFHQNEIKWAKQDKGVNVWVDTRVWAKDEFGHPIGGVNAVQSYTKDVTAYIPTNVELPVPKEHPWAVGVTYTLTPIRGWGGFIDRDIGPFRFGVEAASVGNTGTVAVRGGIRF